MDILSFLMGRITADGSGGGGGSEAVLIDKTISANGVYDASDDNADGYKKVTAQVPNSYSAGDEGKVVDNGALVAQTAHADVTPTTSDQTIDTTLNNSIKVKGDADLVAGNIKKDVEIFGVTGTYEGGGGTDYPYYLGGYYLSTSRGQTLKVYKNHVIFETHSSYASASIGLRQLGSTLVLPTWISLSAGDVVKFECKNVVNVNNISWNINAKLAETLTSASLGIGNGTHLNGESIEVTLANNEDWGCLFIYIESAGANTSLEFDVELSINGTRVM